jgi:hypothetical protein
MFESTLRPAIFVAVLDMNAMVVKEYLVALLSV